MTTKLKNLLHDIQELSTSEQRELIHIISFSLSRKDQAQEKRFPQTDFWTSKTLEELIQEQNVSPIHDISELAGNFWPEDESVDDFLDYIYGQRREDREKGYEDPLA